MKKYFSIWNIDFKRHKLIGLLSKNRIKYNSIDKTGVKMGVSYDDILKVLKCDMDKLDEITPELYEENEIIYTNIHHKGLYSTRKGIASFKNRKYIKRFEDLWVIFFKNISQILIPVISLIITFYVIIEDKKSTDIKLQELKEEILDKILKIENHINQAKKMDNDSLNTE